MTQLLVTWLFVVFMTWKFCFPWILYVKSLFYRCFFFVKVTTDSSKHNKKQMEVFFVKLFVLITDLSLVLVILTRGR